jgi:phage terminase large subunit
MIEIKISLQPKQKSFRDEIEKTQITLFGGARGGGKSYALRNIFLLRRFQYDNSAGAIFRKSYPELEANHIRPLFQEHPQLRQFWNDSKKLLTLPNGSTLQFSHCSNDQDVLLYQGREIQDLGIDEVGQWTESMFRTLLGSNRSSLPGVPARCALTANPGGIGHAWLKRLFIEKRFNERERPKDHAFIQSLVSDNAALIDNDPDYVHKLQTEPNEALRRAYLYGDWDIQAGQYFGEIRREVHFIKPFTIPEHWQRFGAYDFGFNHPAAFGWFACDEDGNVYMYREFIKAQQRVDQFAEQVKRFEDTKKLNQVVAGWDCWSKKSIIKQGSPPTIAEEFLNHDIILSRAKIDRVQGANQLRNYLAWQNLSNGRTRPRFFIFETCPLTYDCLTRMQHDPDHVEDVLKQDATDGDPNSGDDAYDMVRYALMSRPLLADQLKNQFAPGSAEWNRKQVEEMEEVIQKQIKEPDELWGDHEPEADFGTISDISQY